ncbi:MAG: DUF3341 domain-containing protein [Deltaproteobacteria bacterium]|nr:DUF3341 domain-containing protein [Deltaproteobacteria bacterium]
MSNLKLWGVLAQYENPHALYHACEQVRDAGYKRWDACTPFPVHGLEKAMGVAPSMLPWIVLICGIAGSSFGLWFQAWTSGSLYPFIVGGKPLFSMPAFVPVWYEITVLSSCLAAFFGNWILNGLPRPHHPAFGSRAFERVTDDKFFIMIESKDPKFDLEGTKSFLSQSGATLVEELEG